jgi:hypothetical protein
MNIAYVVTLLYYMIRILTLDSVNRPPTFALQRYPSTIFARNLNWLLMLYKHECRCTLIIYLIKFIIYVLEAELSYFIMFLLLTVFCI